MPVTAHEMTTKVLAPVLEAQTEASLGLCPFLVKRRADCLLIASADIDKTVPPSWVAAWFTDRLCRLIAFAAAR